MAVFTGANVRRTARLWSWGALIAAPVFALLGIAGMLGLGSFGGPPSAAIERSGPAGTPLELGNSVHGEAIWGQPAADLSAVSCVASRSDGSGVELPVGTVEGRPTQIEEAPSGATWFWLTTTADQPVSSSVTCSGGGLETVGVSVDPGDGTRGVPGAPFLVFAVFLAVAGTILRRMSAPQRA